MERHPSHFEKLASIIHCAGIGVAGSVAALSLMIAKAHGSVVVHGASEVLNSFCRQEDGRLWLLLPTGARHELITSTWDPAIANPGDGRFHPFDEAEVSRALDQVSYPLGSIRVDVYLLPYPRRDVLESAAGPGIVLLAPGVLDLAPEVQHATVTHEFGHVVHRALMPDSDLERWARYRQLRGLIDETVFHPAAPHANRPHEIFAEDFRALFGGAPANYSGTIENPSLALPGQVPGLRDFMLGVAAGAAGPAVVAGTLRADPSPGGDLVRFGWRGVDAAPVELFDVSGRRVRTLWPNGSDGVWAATWDGRDDQGRPLPSAIWFARVRGSNAPPIRVARLRGLIPASGG